MTGLSRMYGAGKDVFYRFMNNDNLDWLMIMSHITRQLWRKVNDLSDNTGFPVCPEYLSHLSKLCSKLNAV